MQQRYESKREAIFGSLYLFNYAYLAIRGYTVLYHCIQQYAVNHYWKLPTWLTQNPKNVKDKKVKSKIGQRKNKTMMLVDGKNMIATLCD